jgi:hypothetical protein
MSAEPTPLSDDFEDPRRSGKESSSTLGLEPAYGPQVQLAVPGDMAVAAALLAVLLEDSSGWVPED